MKHASVILMSLLTLSLTLTASLNAADDVTVPAYENHSYVAVPPLNPVQQRELFSLGLDIARVERDGTIKIVATARERDMLLDRFNAAVEIDNMEEYNASRVALGATMGGYRTLAETEAEAAALQTAHPDIVRVDTIGFSYEGRAIFAIKISDNVQVDEEEPEVMLNGLIHAREVISNELIMYYFNYLMDNLGGPLVDSIIAQTELWLVPVSNPDGFYYNELTNPEGGGMWRKTRRPNWDGSYGIDLNRNYGAGWGYDDLGSSPVPSSEVYRGTGPFSEPESQVMRDFFNSHDFVVAANYHAYGNFMNHPPSYRQFVINQDDLVYNPLGESIASLTGYGYATYEGYGPNGSAYDWQYLDQSQKKKTFGILIEVGPGFWPDTSEIVPLCEENLQSNIFITRWAQDVWKMPTRAIATDFEWHDTTITPDCAEPYSKPVTFRNIDGDMTLDVSLFPVDMSPYSGWYTADSVDTILFPGDSVTVDLNFDPDAFGGVPNGTVLVGYLRLSVADHNDPAAENQLVFNIRTTVGPIDPDGDGVDIHCDNCPETANPGQTDSDGDGQGDPCDNCPQVANTAQADSDGDSVGDACDVCPGFSDLVDSDGDGIADGCDNCPDLANPNQADLNNNGLGDLCEACCRNLTGNVNHDDGDAVDISDLTTIVNHLFVTFEDLPCPAEANVSGDAACVVDLSDLTALVNHLFVTFAPPSACDIMCE